MYVIIKRVRTNVLESGGPSHKVFYYYTCTAIKLNVVQLTQECLRSMNLHECCFTQYMCIFYNVLHRIKSRKG